MVILALTLTTFVILFSHWFSTLQESHGQRAEHSGT